MRVPLSWLKEYVEVEMPAQALADKLTIAGLEVESIDYIGIPGGNDKKRLVWDREKLLMGQILKVEPHPDADRLVLATVDYGGDEPELVVTGAPNLFPYLEQGDVAELGLYSPFVLEGGEVYDGHKEGQVKMKLKGRKLRGIYNRCMLCSEKELGLSDEHEGIMILDDAEYTPGTPLQDLLGDVVFNIDIIPNIARCASILGVAREVAALTGQKVRYPSFEVTQEGAEIGESVTISTDDPDLNPRFVALVIDNVEQKPSPAWMQRRLQMAGQRPINVVVDISNYVMLEVGEPNHTFDYDYLRKRADGYAGIHAPIHIHTRLPHDGETLTTLDGEERELLPYNILVTDPAGNLSIGGIMGGRDSEISDGTTSVLLEAAAWNFINIRRSMHALKMNTEAGFRFSRGVHPAQALLGAKRAAELLRTLAGGTVRRGIVDYYPNPPRSEPILLTCAELKRLAGIELTPNEIAGMLQALEFKVDVTENGVLATAPDHRLDITGAHDLVEEVCRVYGYDRLPTTLMEDGLPPQRSNVALEQEEQVKDILSGLGWQEIITYRMTTPEREGRLLPAENAPPDDRPYITLQNPINIERVAMRHSVLAAGLDVVANNSRFRQDMALFEIGQIYLASEEGVLPDEPRRLAMVLMGARAGSFWGDGESAGICDFFDLKGALEGLFEALHVENVSFKTESHPSWRPGRTARLWLDGKHLGWAGELHPLVGEGFNIRSEHPVLAAELDLDLLLAAVPARHAMAPVINYPPVVEDLALVVDAGMPADQVAAAIRQAGGFLLQDVTLFDLYAGEQLPAGKKSLAYRLTWQAPNKTLSDRDMGKQRQRLLRLLKQQIGAELR